MHEAVRAVGSGVYDTLRMSSYLQGKRILITGAGRGIGKRFAIGLAAKGATVGLVARTKAEIDLTHLEIQHAGGVSLRLPGDVRELDRMIMAVERMRASFGGTDVLIAAAGVQGPIGLMHDADTREWRETFETNVFGVMHACRAVLPEMVQRRAGKIIVVSGGGSLSPRPHFSAYAASKSAIVRFVETIATEYAEHNVQANCLAPGGTYTNMTDEILAAGEERAGWKEIEDARQVRITGGIPLEKQLKLATFLASEDSNHVSGKVLRYDDDWKKLAHGSVSPELFTLRRVTKS